MSFFLYPGNKLEILAGICCRLLGDEPGSDPMIPETIVVPTQGMAVYLRQFFARRNGVAANIDMPFPAGFISGILKKNIDGFDAASKNFSQEQLAWDIFSIFQHESGEFPELAGYIGSSNDAILKTWQLANRTAVLFDRYQIYRYKDEYFPLKNDEWQSRLWKKLLHKYGKSKMQCCREFLELDRPVEGLPKRLTVFGVGSLPPLYLDMFFKISETVDLRFFYMTPCREFWENLYSVKEKKWLCKDGNMPEVGNPLLASWGTAGRELFTNLLAHQDNVPYVSSEELLFEDYYDNAEEATILQQLQQDILTMHDGRQDKKQPVKDDSIEILNCYAPKREVEILHDKLLTVFNAKEADPGDVIVMAPDINAYLPYINAVFGQGPLKYSYTVSDRNLRSRGGVSNVFRRLLDLPNCRMEVDDVMGILNNPFVCRSRDITAGEIEVISGWIKKSGVRWGVDGADHSGHCSVAFDEYSWRGALDNIFEHFVRGCTAEEELADVKNILSESDLELFGKFNRFFRELAGLRSELSRLHTVGGWMDLLLDTLDRFFVGTDKETGLEIASLRRYFYEQKSLGEKVAKDAMLSCSVIVDMVDGFLNTAQDRFSFLRGKITFCSLTPLRSVPASVIAVLGLDDGAFPRRDTELGFDLMTARLLPGDRSGAKEDRYLFLEALMSARKKFWCFYNGHSRRTGKKLEPSVMLGEFEEYLKQWRDFHETVHYLHGFDPRYFSGDAPQNAWSQEDFRTAKLLNAARVAPEARNSELDKLSVGEFSNCKLEDLIKWASHPAEYVFRQSLDVKFFSPEGNAASEAIIRGSALEQSNLRRAIDKFKRISGADDDLYQLMKCSNMLPPGESGSFEFKKELALMRAIPQEWLQEFYEQEHLALEFEVELEDSRKVKISGMFDCSRALDKQKIMAYSSFKYKYYINAFLRHMALCMISDAPDVVTSLYCFEGGKWQEMKLFHRIDGNFWRDFMQKRIDFDKRIPAIFPATLFYIQSAAKEKTKADRREKLTSLCRKELADDLALARCFAPDCMDDEALKEEFLSFEKLFFYYL